jgi:hypothetical protein
MRIDKLGDHIKMDLIEIIRDDAEWIHLAQNRDKWQATENFQVP